MQRLEAYPVHRIAALVILTVCLLGGLALSLSTSSCCAPGVGVLPSRAFVDASRELHGVIGPRFLAYVAADPALDAVTKETLAGAVGDWEFMLRQAEAALPPATPAAPVAGAVVR
jgi:hypothetical protein